MSNQTDGGAHCFQPECQTTPNILNDKGLKPMHLYANISGSRSMRDI